MQVSISVAVTVAALASLLSAAEPTSTNATSPQAAQPEYNPILLPCFKRLYGVDIAGSDVGSERAGNSDACFALCKARSPACKAFTWTDYNGGTCWLKSGFSTGAFKPGAVTGFSGSLCYDVTMVQLMNCDIPGGDVSSEPGTNYNACLNRCNSNKYECGAFTWTDYQGGTCWFKRAFSGCQYKANAFSAARPDETFEL